MAEQTIRLTLAVYADRPRHPRVADARGVYSRTLASLERIDEALAQLQEGQALARDLFGETSLMVGFFAERAVGLATYLGDLELARSSGSLAVEALSQHFGPVSYSLATALSARGYSNLYSRRPTEALEDIEAALDILAETRGETSERYLLVAGFRSLAMAQQGRVDEAVEAMAAVVDGFVSQDFQVPPMLSWAGARCCWRVATWRAPDPRWSTLWNLESASSTRSASLLSHARRSEWCSSSRENPSAPSTISRLRSPRSRASSNR